MLIKRTLLVLSLIAFSGCGFFGKKEYKPIFVGEPETIIVEPPDGAAVVSYNWRIDDLPDESLLVPDFSASSNVFTFTADVEGDYSFSAVVSVRSEEVADHIFRFTAVEDTSVVPMLFGPVTQATQLDPDGRVRMDAATAATTMLNSAAASTPPPTKEISKPPAKKPAKPKRAPRKVQPDVIAGHFTIQVSSWNTAKKAQSVEQSLENFGYETYIQRVWLEDKNEVWWRVRLGDFNDVERARTVRDQLAPRFPDVWVDNLRRDVVETD